MIIEGGRRGSVVLYRFHFVLFCAAAVDFTKAGVQDVNEWELQPQFEVGQRQGS